MQWPWESKNKKKILNLIQKLQKKQMIKRMGAVEKRKKQLNQKIQPLSGLARKRSRSIRISLALRPKALSPNPSRGTLSKSYCPRVCWLNLNLQISINRNLLKHSNSNIASDTKVSLYTAPRSLLIQTKTINFCLQTRLKLLKMKL